jgi:hypothetical protein
MAKKPEKPANITVRAVDAELKAEVKAFFDAATITRNVKDEADLVRKGIRYFLRDYKRAGGLVDASGFPVVPPNSPPMKLQGK